MKKFILLITTLAFVMTMFGTGTVMSQTSPSNLYKNTIGTTIIFWPRPNPGKPRPRSVVFAPVTATYNYSSQSLHFDFTENIGEMTIIVINHSTGEQSFEFVDSAFESAEVYISGDEGQYSIGIEAQDGSSYYAEFTIF